MLEMIGRRAAVMDIALQIAWEFHLDPPATDLEEFHGLGDRLMDELLKLEQCNTGVHDSTVSTDFSRGCLLVEMLILGTDVYEVTKTALDVVRTAIHAVEVATPTWPSPHDLVNVEFRAGEMRTKPVDVPAFA